MNPTVYIETTVISYLTAWPKKVPLIAGQQDETRKWWAESRPSFEVFTSALVLAEAAAGDPVAAAERLAVLQAIPALPVTDEAKALGNALVANTALPAKAHVDALHVGIAATSGIRYLLTWNCRHLANATLRARIDRVCRDRDCEPPIICTPSELTQVNP